MSFAINNFSKALRNHTNYIIFLSLWLDFNWKLWETTTMRSQRHPYNCLSPQALDSLRARSGWVFCSETNLIGRWFSSCCLNGPVISRLSPPLLERNVKFCILYSTVLTATWTWWCTVKLYYNKWNPSEKLIYLEKTPQSSTIPLWCVFHKRLSPPLNLFTVDVITLKWDSVSTSSVYLHNVLHSVLCKVALQRTAIQKAIYWVCMGFNGIVAHQQGTQVYHPLLQVDI